MEFRSAISMLIVLATTALLPASALAFECVDFEARPWSQFISDDAGDCAVNEVEGRCMELDEVEDAVETDAGETLERGDAGGPSRLPLVAGACFDPIRCEGIPAQPTTRLAARAPQSAGREGPGLSLGRRGWMLVQASPTGEGLRAHKGATRDIDQPPER
jgi:hypothetical protein